MPLRPISKKIPLLAPFIIESKRKYKSLSTRAKKFKLQTLTSSEIDNYKPIFKHKSLLRRKLGSSDPLLQEKKVINLQLAAPHFNGILIPPQGMFSFWEILGKPETTRGFVEGMLISNGKVISGVGGGLCQLANLLYWMFLHSPLEIKEHHHHQLDIFPDSGRVLPFGSGASIFYNYVDLQVKNSTTQNFLLKVWVDDTFLHGELSTDQNWPYTYTVLEENHRFYASPTINKVFRQNELFQITIDKATGHVVDKKLITKNNSQVLYKVDFPIPLA